MRKVRTSKHYDRASRTIETARVKILRHLHDAAASHRSSNNGLARGVQCQHDVRPFFALQFDRAGVDVHEEVERDARQRLGQPCRIVQLVRGGQLTTRLEPLD
jgi:hypothetical protein